MSEYHLLNMSARARAFSWHNSLQQCDGITCKTPLNFVSSANDSKTRNGDRHFSLLIDDWLIKILWGIAWSKTCRAELRKKF